MKTHNIKTVNFNILELSPPNWILDTWLKSGVSNEGFRFEQNDIYILDGANDEISFLDTRIEVLSEGHGYILKDELSFAGKPDTFKQPYCIRCLTKHA